MKKSYIQPSMKAYTIKVNTILAGSEPAPVNAVGDKNQLSKGSNIWTFMDDFEDEDNEQ